MTRLPVRRTGTLINKRLRTLTALKSSGIEKRADLQGKKVGYAVPGLEEAIIGRVLRHVGPPAPPASQTRRGRESWARCSRRIWTPGATPPIATSCCGKN